MKDPENDANVYKFKSAVTLDKPIEVTKMGKG